MLSAGLLSRATRGVSARSRFFGVSEVVEGVKSEGSSGFRVIELLRLVRRILDDGEGEATRFVGVARCFVGVSLTQGGGDACLYNAHILYIY